MLLLHEWPLVLFTLLAQTAVGIVLVGECLLLKTDDTGARTRIRRQSGPAFAILAVAGLISLGHTGSPLNSFHTLSNLGSSWLSLEIALLSLVGFGLLWLAFMRWKAPVRSPEKIVALAVIILGLALVVTMSRVYRLSVVPAWDTYSGLTAFIGSVFLMGALWHGVIESRSGRFQGADGSWRTMTLITFALAGAVLAAMSLPLGVPTSDTGLNTATLLLPVSCIASSLALRILLTGIGIMLFTLALVGMSRKGKGFRHVPVPAFLLVLAGELLGRSIFYLSYARLGM